MVSYYTVYFAALSILPYMCLLALCNWQAKGVCIGNVGRSAALSAPASCAQPVSESQGSRTKTQKQAVICVSLSMG